MKLTRIVVLVLVAAIGIPTACAAAEAWKLPSIWPFGSQSNKKNPKAAQRAAMQRQSKPAAKQPPVLTRVGNSTKQMWTKTKSALTPSFVKSRPRPRPSPTSFNSNRRNSRTESAKKKESLGAKLTSWILPKKEKAAPDDRPRTTQEWLGQRRVGEDRR